MKTKSILSYKTAKVRYRKNNKTFVKLFLGIIAASLFSGCEPKDVFEEENTIIPPTGQKVVRVEPDDGVTRVNSLTKAIKENGNGIYELERGGIYYLEGKNVISSNVTIRATYGSGSLPTIQPISDEQGALNSDMLRFEGNATFENIYFNGKDAASNSIMQRLFRLDKKNLRLRFEGCFVENCRNFCIRTDNSGIHRQLHFPQLSSNIRPCQRPFVRLSRECARHHLHHQQHRIQPYRSNHSLRSSRGQIC